MTIINDINYCHCNCFDYDFDRSEESVTVELRYKTVFPELRHFVILKRGTGHCNQNGFY